MNHTPACEKNQKATPEWVAAHPNYCRKCGGFGEWSTPDGQWEPGDGGPCSTCVEEGKCPHCGEYALKGEEEPHCEACGWKTGDPGCPDAECECWEETEPDSTDWDDRMPEDEPAPEEYDF